MNLTVRYPSFYDGTFPFVGLPCEIGHFSVGSSRNFCNDAHQLKYLAMPSNASDLFMDLNIGYAEGIRKDSNRKENLDFFLKWILYHQEDVRKHFMNHSNTSLKIDFVCYRGLLTALCGTIYERNEDWIICATKYRSVIYLCAFHTEQRNNREKNLTEKDKLMCSWGYKFEQYMTADSVNSKPNTSVPVNENEEYDSVMKGKLEDYRILFSAEVDGVDPMNCSQNQNSMSRYIELKTSKIICNERVHKTYCRYKLIKWWLQSFLAGIPSVICGFRDDKGIIRTLESINVKDMPKIAKGFWSPSACLNFLISFLDHVKKCVVKDDPNVVYKFYWKPGSEVICEELNPPGEYKILPDWYIEKLTL